MGAKTKTAASWECRPWSADAKARRGWRMRRALGLEKRAGVDCSPRSRLLHCVVMRRGRVGVGVRSEAPPAPSASTQAAHFFVLSQLPEQQSALPVQKPPTPLQHLAWTHVSLLGAVYWLSQQSVSTVQGPLVAMQHT